MKITLPYAENPPYGRAVIFNPTGFAFDQLMNRFSRRPHPWLQAKVNRHAKNKKFRIIDFAGQFPSSSGCGLECPLPTLPADGCLPLLDLHGRRAVWAWSAEPLRLWRTLKDLDGAAATLSVP